MRECVKIRTLPSQQPWTHRGLRVLLTSCDAAYWAGDKVALSEARNKLKPGTKPPKNNYRQSVTIKYNATATNTSLSDDLNTIYTCHSRQHAELGTLTVPRRGQKTLIQATGPDHVLRICANQGDLQHVPDLLLFPPAFNHHKCKADDNHTWTFGQPSLEQLTFHLFFIQLSVKGLAQGSSSRHLMDLGITTF